MPEVVEVNIQALQLRKSLAGRVIEDVVVRDKGEKIVRFPLQDFKNLLKGAKIMDISRLGKSIIFGLIKDEKTFFLRSELRMTGRWLLNVPEEQLGHTRLTFILGNDTLRYSDVRVFGVINLYDDLSALFRAARKGVDVLDGGYQLLYQTLFHAVQRNPRLGMLNIKQLILDQTILAGLGNVYSNETLHRAKIHPGTLAKVVIQDAVKLSKLIVSMKEVLEQGYKHGGLSLRDWYHIDGTKGKAQEHLRVYKKETCRCGTRIKRDVVLDSRTTYYCPCCQVLEVD